MSVEAALQKAIVGTLKENAALPAIVAGRVYDRVPADAPRPYAHIRNIPVVDDGAECIEGYEISIDPDVWSDVVGKVEESVEASRAASAIRAALNAALLTLDVSDSRTIDLTLASDDLADGIIGEYIDGTTMKLAEVSSAPEGASLAKPSRIQLPDVTRCPRDSCRRRPHLALARKSQSRREASTGFHRTAC